MSIKAYKEYRGHHYTLSEEDLVWCGDLDTGHMWPTEGALKKAIDDKLGVEDFRLITYRDITYKRLPNGVCFCDGLGHGKWLMREDDVKAAIDEHLGITPLPACCAFCRHWLCTAVPGVEWSELTVEGAYVTVKCLAGLYDTGDVNELHTADYQKHFLDHLNCEKFEAINGN